MRLIKTIKIVIPVLLVGGALASYAYAGQSRSDRSIVRIPSSSPNPSSVPSPAVSMSVDGTEIPVGQGVTHYSDGKSQVTVDNSGGAITTQTTSGTGTNTTVTHLNDGNVSVSVNSNSTGGNSQSQTNVSSFGATSVYDNQSTIVRSFSSNSQ